MHIPPGSDAGTVDGAVGNAVVHATVDQQLGLAARTPAHGIEQHHQFDIAAILIGAQQQLDTLDRVEPERLLLGQHGGQKRIGRRQIPPAGGIEQPARRGCGSRCTRPGTPACRLRRSLEARQHRQAHALMLQVGQPGAWLQHGGPDDARPGIDALRRRLGPQHAKLMRLQPQCGRLETRTAVRRIARPPEVPQIGIEHHDVRLAAVTGAMPPHPPGQLDQRAHRRRLDHRPVVVMVASDLGDRRAKHDEDLVRRTTGVDALAHIRQVEDGRRPAPVQRRVDATLDGRADQQRKLRVVDAQVNLHTRRRAQPVQRQSHLDQRFDVGHADQSEADTAATVRVEGVMLPMQRQRGITCQSGESCGLLVSGNPGQRQRLQPHPPAHFNLDQPLGTACGEVPVSGLERGRIAAVGDGLAELVEPQTADRGRAPGRTGLLATVALELQAPVPVGLEQTLHQGWRQRGRRQQHPCAQHPGPVHQPGQCGQVVDVEVIGLVQHQIAAHQTQHRRDLPAAPLALGGGHQMVDGAHQQRRQQHRTHRRITHRALQQRMGIDVALEADVAALLVEQRLRGCGTTGLRLLRVVVEQFTAGTAAHADGQILVAQIQQIPEGPAGLQRQGTQPQREGTAHAAFRIGQRVHHAGVGQRLATAGRGHVDDEGPLPLRALAHAGGQFGGLVLPAETLIGRAATQPLVTRQPGQMLLEARQRPRHLAAMLRHTEQMLVERLVELARPAGVGVQRVAGRHLDTPRIIALEAGIVVIGQHQAQARQMHHVRIGEPVARPGLLQPTQQPPGDAHRAPAPQVRADRQAVPEPPVRLDRGAIPVARALVPCRVDLLQHTVQAADLELGGTAVRPGRQHRQPMMRHHQPPDRLRQRRVPERRERCRQRAAVHAVTPEAVDPGGVVRRSRRDQPLQPGGIVIGAHKGLEQPQRHPFMPILVALDQPAGQPVLEGLARLAQVVQQRGQRGQQVDVLPGVPVVLVVRTQHVAGGRLRRHGALRVEAAGIADDPQQLAVVQAADPVTGHRRVAACRLAQQASQRVQTVLRDRCLPGPVAAPLGELVEDATGFHQRALVALRDQQDVHQDAVEEGSGTRACAPRRKATALSVSIMKSSDSLRVRVSMQAWRNSCSVSPRMAEMKA